MTRHTPIACVAVFRVGANAPATCALRFNHAGAHRDWMQAADDRAALYQALRDLLWHVETIPHPTNDQIADMATARAALRGAEGVAS